MNAVTVVRKRGSAPGTDDGGAAGLDEAGLRAGAVRLRLELPEQAFDRMEAYLQLLQRWGRTYNLTSILEPRAMRAAHLMDSLSLVPHLPKPGPAIEGSTGSGWSPVMADVGSGAGLPGVVVAIACPDWQVVCIDAVGKKVGFIRQVAAELRLPNLQALQARVESVHGLPEWQRWAPAGATVVASRAFASLVDFVEKSSSLRAPDGGWFALKGQVPHAELAELAELQKSTTGRAGSTAEVIPLEVPGLDAQRCLVRIR